MLCYAVIAGVLMLSAFHVSGFDTEPMSWSASQVWFFSLFCSPLGFIVARLDRTQMRLCQQISNFKMRNTECYCCSIDHQCPVGGGTIPCDRQFVERNIQRWLVAADSATHDSDGREAFEQHVRKNLGAQLMHSSCDRS